MADFPSRLKLSVVRRLDPGHAALYAFLHSHDAQIAMRATEQIFGQALPQSHTEWQAWLEECYRVAQHRGCQLSGWQMRFAIYFQVGRQTGMW